MKHPRYYPCPQCGERIDTKSQFFEECGWCGDHVHVGCLEAHLQMCEYNEDVRASLDEDYEYKPFN